MRAKRDRWLADGLKIVRVYYDREKKRYQTEWEDDEHGRTCVIFDPGSLSLDDMHLTWEAAREAVVGKLRREAEKLNGMAEPPPSGIWEADE